jgi:hypothetical protein
VYLVALDTKGKEPVELFSAPPGDAGDFFWLSNDTAAYLNDTSLYSFGTNISSKGVKREHIFDFPEGIAASSLQYDRKSGYLGFTAQVWEHGDGTLEGVKKMNDKYEGRGDTGQVYDELFIRYVLLLDRDSQDRTELVDIGIPGGLLVESGQWD